MSLSDRDPHPPCSSSASLESLLHENSGRREGGAGAVVEEGFRGGGGGGRGDGGGGGIGMMENVDFQVLLSRLRS